MSHARVDLVVCKNLIWSHASFDLVVWKNLTNASLISEAARISSQTAQKWIRVFALSNRKPCSYWSRISSDSIHGQEEMVSRPDGLMNMYAQESTRWSGSVEDLDQIWYRRISKELAMMQDLVKSTVVIFVLYHGESRTHSLWWRPYSLQASSYNPQEARYNLTNLG